MEEVTLALQLHKLSAINSEEELDQILTTLWKTRRTGLCSDDKSRFQSILNLTSLPQLDSVLACLRWVIRKCVHEDLSGDQLLKLFPPDLPLQLQSMLLLLLHKHQSQWKEDVSKEQHPLPRTSVTYQVKTNVPSSFLSSENSMPHWPCRDDPGGHINPNALVTSTPTHADATTSHYAPISIQQDAGPLDNLAILPHLKSMTWNIEKRNSPPANRAAIITLKLQDNTNSSSGEMDVKFQLTRDALDAMLRSMRYISEQLASVVGTSSGPAQKKQKQ